MVTRMGVDTRRIAAVVAVLAITVALLGRSAFGSFTGEATVTHTAQAGVLALSATNGDGAQPFGSGLIELGPGSSNQRLANLTIGNDLDFKTLEVLIRVCLPSCVSSLLDSDTTNGIQVAIDRCSQAWTGSGTAPNKTYTCGGTTEVVQTAFPIIATKSLTVDPSDSLVAAGSVNYYRFTFSLPTTSPDAHEGLASGIDYVFNGTQRDAANK